MRIRRLEPPERLTFECRRNAAPSRAIVKKQDNVRAALPTRLLGKSERPHCDRIERQSKLLAHLPNQRKSRSLHDFHLPARKLPLSGVALSGKCLLEQQAALPVADRRRNDGQPCRNFCHRKNPCERIVKAVLALPTTGTKIGGSDAMKIVKQLLRLARDSRGATAIEYGLIVSLIVIAMIGALRGLADENTGMWSWVEDDVLAATNP